MTVVAGAGSTSAAASAADLLSELRTSRLARAYCGPAHGRCWPLSDEVPPPTDVVLEVDEVSVSYRLIRHPRNHRPARDRRGHYLYMPMPLRA